jgi:hypothetical protein
LLAPTSSKTCASTSPPPFASIALADPPHTCVPVLIARARNKQVDLLTAGQYRDVVAERAVAGLCGFPLCPNYLTTAHAVPVRLLLLFCCERVRVSHMFGGGMTGPAIPDFAAREAGLRRERPGPVLLRRVPRQRPAGGGPPPIRQQRPSPAQAVAASPPRGLIAECFPYPTRAVCRVQRLGGGWADHRASGGGCALHGFPRHGRRRGLRVGQTAQGHRRRPGASEPNAQSAPRRAPAATRPPARGVAHLPGQERRRQEGEAGGVVIGRRRPGEPAGHARGGMGERGTRHPPGHHGQAAHGAGDSPRGGLPPGQDPGRAHLGPNAHPAAHTEAVAATATNRRCRGHRRRGTLVSLYVAPARRCHAHEEAQDAYGEEGDNNITSDEEEDEDEDNFMPEPMLSLFAQLWTTLSDWPSSRSRAFLKRSGGSQVRNGRPWHSSGRCFAIADELCQRVRAIFACGRARAQRSS